MSSSFKERAQRWLETLAVALEAKYAGESHETDDHVELRLESGQTYLWHIHYGMEQIWYASPISGGRHFNWTLEGWRDSRNGEILTQVVKQELGVCCES